MAEHGYKCEVCYETKIGLVKATHFTNEGASTTHSGFHLYCKEHAPPNATPLDNRPTLSAARDEISDVFDNYGEQLKQRDPEKYKEFREMFDNEDDINEHEAKDD